ncbi:unnamed protein product [Thelazia callipaeda]|uniref:HOOK_N domain-containing protein n=1 Tax=Thelazia callipaeda TaxID=103827 RepID=A0A0N5CRW6_THECL|nr:unnamed protein product [Thelazia callipaeda]
MVVCKTCESDVNTVLLLLLGCAVHGEQRTKFIERIKRMENDLQAALVSQIKKVVEEGDCVLDVKTLELISGGDQKTLVLTHMERIMNERDKYAGSLYEISSERESDDSSSKTGSSFISNEIIRTGKHADIKFDGRMPSPNSMERHNNVELASAKAEVRKLRNMIEEREEVIAELKDQAEAREVNILKMQQERLELIKDARAAKDYRDEVECLQHKLVNYDKLETDNAKLKERVSELEFFKSRVTQLKEENSLMEESCSVLENQLEQCQRKVSNYLNLELKLADYQDQIKQHLSNISEDQKKIENLLVENGHLERKLEREQKKTSDLERKLGEYINGEVYDVREDFGSLATQLSDNDKKRILELELENRKLKTKLESSSDCEESDEMRTKLLRTEIELVEKKKQCEFLSRKVDEFKATLSRVNSEHQEVFCINWHLAQLLK